MHAPLQKLSHNVSVGAGGSLKPAISANPFFGGTTLTGKFQSRIQNSQLNTLRMTNRTRNNFQNLTKHSKKS